jgi:hypothetical protein
MPEDKKIITGGLVGISSQRRTKNNFASWKAKE